MKGLRIKKSIKNWIPSLTIAERGVMISIALVRDEESPVFTLAKFKQVVKYSEITEQLISLHQKDFIEWEGYDKALKSKKQTKSYHQACDIIDFMNGLYRRKFSYRDTNLNMIIARLRDYDEEDIKAVIANRYAEWKDEPIMKKYLQPSTIFQKSKFDKYHEEYVFTKSGKKYLVVDNLDLEQDQVLTLELVEKFDNKQHYPIKYYRTTNGGERLGSGTKVQRTKAQLQKSLKAEERNQRNGDPQEFIYTYYQD